jgi:hypothetical protein
LSESGPGAGAAEARRARRGRRSTLRRPSPGSSCPWLPEPWVR